MNPPKNSFTTATPGRLTRLLLSLAAFLPFAGCGPPEPVLEYSLNTPPLILAPAAAAGVVDGRGRFREIYCAVQQDHGSDFPHDRPCEEALHRLSGEPPGTGRPIHLGRARTDLRVLIVPGTFSECVQDIFTVLPYARSHIEEHGYKTGLIMVGGRSSTTHNARQIRDYLTALDPPASERIVLLGYSKGTADTLEAVVNHPEVAQRVAAVVSFAGIVSGTPLADSLSAAQNALFKHLNVPTCPEGDAGGLHSLRRETRLTWLAEHPLPRAVRYFSVTAFAEREQISSIIQSEYDTLAVIDPRNDSHAIFFDTVIPGSTLLGYAHADHWAIALPVTQDMPQVAKTLITRNEFPREVFFEAIVRFVEEALLEGR